MRCQAQGKHLKSENHIFVFSFSLEREVLKSLLALMMLTSYDKFDFYHYKTVRTEEASMLVVGARGQGIFVEV